MSGENLKGKSMRTATRALAVLTCLGDRREGMTLQQLHLRLEIPLGSMHRLLSTLEDENFISRSTNTKRYTLGTAALALTKPDAYGSFLVPPPKAAIEASRESGETVFLTQMIDSRVICISLVESVHALRLFVRVGQEMPLHAAASARVILAYRDPVFVEALLAAYPRESFTRGTLREVNQVIDHLTEVRRHGFDVCSSELDDGVWAVAAPVFNAPGQVEFGVTLAAASGRVQDPARRADLTRLIRRAAAELSRSQGYQGDLGADISVTELAARYDSAKDEHLFTTSTTGGATR